MRLRVRRFVSFTLRRRADGGAFRRISLKLKTDGERRRFPFSMPVFYARFLYAGFAVNLIMTQ